MRQVLSAVLVLGVLIQSAAASPDTASVTTQIVGMPLGANIELRLKNKQKVRGARGAISATSFALVDSHAGEQQIAFDDVASVKLFTPKSHTTRNILIGVGITLLILGIIGSRV
jgi:hypothetical protein